MWDRHQLGARRLRRKTRPTVDSMAIAFAWTLGSGLEMEEPTGFHDALLPFWEDGRDILPSSISSLRIDGDAIVGFCEMFP